jgi:hypothetical protein
VLIRSFNFRRRFFCELPDQLNGFADREDRLRQLRQCLLSGRHLVEKPGESSTAPPEARSDCDAIAATFALSTCLLGSTILQDERLPGDTLLLPGQRTAARASLPIDNFRTNARRSSVIVSFWSAGTST